MATGGAVSVTGDASCREGVRVGKVSEDGETSATWSVALGIFATDDLAFISWVTWNKVVAGRAMLLRRIFRLLCTKCICLTMANLTRDRNAKMKQAARYMSIA